MLSLDKYEMIFWDFDGVIKESVSVKTDAYVELFRPYGSHVCKKIRKHPQKLVRSNLTIHLCLFQYLRDQINPHHYEPDHLSYD